ncbi:MAG: hypothetical protein OHK0011_08300 [Turneriella sp.]
MEFHSYSNPAMEFHSLDMNEWSYVSSSLPPPQAGQGHVNANLSQKILKAQPHSPPRVRGGVGGGDRSKK